MIKPTRIDTITSYDDKVTLDLDYGTLDLSIIREDILRLTLFWDENRFVPPVEPDLNQVAPTLTQPGSKLDSVRFAFGTTHLQISSEPLQIRLFDQTGRTIWETLPRRTFLKDRFGKRWHYQTKEEGSAYYGLGEKTGPLMRNDRAFQLKSVDAIGYDPELGDPLYKHIPFFMKYDKGAQHTTGFYLNNAYPSRFDFGSERSGYWGPYLSIEVDDGPFDLFVFTGPDPKSVLQQYFTITGFPAMPTRASLGYLGSSMFYTERADKVDAGILDFVGECHSREIPISGFHLSSGYTKRDDQKRYVFHWDKKRIPDPAEFVSTMAAAGVVLSPNIKPGLLTTHPLWSKFDAAGAFIRSPDGSCSLTERFWGGDASFVDFSHPAGRELWKEALKESLLKLGIIAIWNDNNEFEIDEDEALCWNDGDPILANAIRPILANRMAEIAYTAIEEVHSKRPFVLSRAGFSGIQKYAQTWSGDNHSDWKNFNWNLATMLGSSLSGIPLTGMDIGGFSGPAPEPELLLRWVQNGIFHPRFSIHSVNNDNTVTEPWMYRSVAEQIKTAIRTRYLLMPTLYSIAAEAHLDGIPIVAPLFYYFPDDERLKNEHTTFMLGDRLLAVAITSAGCESVEVAIPDGNWRCFYTDQWVNGSATKPIKVDRDYSPLFIRAGRGIVLDTEFIDALAHRDAYPSKSWVVRLLATESGHLTFYEDDGESLDYREGVYLNGRFEWKTSTHRIDLTYTVHGAYDPRIKQLCVEIDLPYRAPVEIVIDGERQTEVRIQSELSKNRWWYDPEAKRAHIRLSSTRLQSGFKCHLSLQQEIDIFLENQPD